MEYVEGQGFILTKGDSWPKILHVLQLVNHQGAWIDEVSVETTSTTFDVISYMSDFIPKDAPYRILCRESVETILEIVN